MKNDKNRRKFLKNSIVMSLGVLGLNACKEASRQDLKRDIS